jgi:hypothetical protein
MRPTDIAKALKNRPYLQLKVAVNQTNLARTYGCDPVFILHFACRCLYQSGSLICRSGARPHAVRPRSARTIQISKHAPTNPAIR